MIDATEAGPRQAHCAQATRITIASSSAPAVPAIAPTRRATPCARSESGSALGGQPSTDGSPVHPHPRRATWSGMTIAVDGSGQTAYQPSLSEAGL